MLLLNQGESGGGVHEDPPGQGVVPGEELEEGLHQQEGYSAGRELGKYGLSE